MALSLKINQKLKGPVEIQKSIARSSNTNGFLSACQNLKNKTWFRAQDRLLSIAAVQATADADPKLSAEAHQKRSALHQNAAAAATTMAAATQVQPKSPEEGLAMGISLGGREGARLGRRLFQEAIREETEIIKRDASASRKLLLEEDQRQRMTELPIDATVTDEDLLVIVDDYLSLHLLDANEEPTTKKALGLALREGMQKDLATARTGLPDSQAFKAAFRAAGRSNQEAEMVLDTFEDCTRWGIVPDLAAVKGLAPSPQMLCVQAEFDELASLDPTRDRERILDLALQRGIVGKIVGRLASTGENLVAMHKLHANTDNQVPRTVAGAAQRMGAHAIGLTWALGKGAGAVALGLWEWAHGLSDLARSAGKGEANLTTEALLGVAALRAAENATKDGFAHAARIVQAPGESWEEVQRDRVQAESALERRAAARRKASEMTSEGARKAVGMHQTYVGLMDQVFAAAEKVATTPGKERDAEWMNVESARDGAWRKFESAKEALLDHVHEMAEIAPEIAWAINEDPQLRPEAVFDAANHTATIGCAEIEECRQQMVYAGLWAPGSQPSAQSHHGDFATILDLGPGQIERSQATACVGTDGQVVVSVFRPEEGPESQTELGEPRSIRVPISLLPALLQAKSIETVRTQSQLRVAGKTKNVAASFNVIEDGKVQLWLEDDSSPISAEYVIEELLATQEAQDDPLLSKVDRRTLDKFREFARAHGQKVWLKDHLTEPQKEGLLALAQLNQKVGSVANLRVANPVHLSRVQALNATLVGAVGLVPDPVFLRQVAGIPAWKAAMKLKTEFENAAASSFKSAQVWQDAQDMSHDESPHERA